MPKTVLGVTIYPLSESLIEKNTPAIPTNFWWPEMQIWIQLMKSNISTDYTQTGVWTEIVWSVKQWFLNILDNLQWSLYWIGIQKIEEASQGNASNDM